MPSCRGQGWDSRGARPGRRWGETEQNQGLGHCPPIPQLCGPYTSCTTSASLSLLIRKMGSQQHPPQRLILGSLGHHPPLLAQSSVPSRCCCRHHRHLLHPHPHYPHRPSGVTGLSTESWCPQDPALEVGSTGGRFRGFPRHQHIYQGAGGWGPGCSGKFLSCPLRTAASPAQSLSNYADLAFKEKLEIQIFT